MDDIDGFRSWIFKYYIKYTITSAIDRHVLHKGNFRDEGT